jgi:hypothetical protein
MKSETLIDPFLWHNFGTAVELQFYGSGFYVFNGFVCFIYGPGQIPITATLNLNQLYVCPELALVVTMKFAPALCFVEFLNCGNRLTSLFAVTNDSVFFILY